MKQKHKKHEETMQPNASKRPQLLSNLTQGYKIDNTVKIKTLEVHSKND